ncbi:MAG: DUF1579 domain-containing protein [Alphaproteobacteria bacterium]|nr:DUF1579 domain-containing protein [Alphaproteobacteria bacterium]
MRTIALASLLLLAAPAAAQRPPDAGALIAAEKAAMAKLAYLDGVWRGPAWTITPGGRHEVTQSERIGPFLGGAVKVIEGRGYNPDGSVGFNAFGTISYDPATQAYILHSYAQGRGGDFPLKVTPDGYVWEVPAGPGAVIRYTATIGNGAWREVGHYIAAAGGEPRQIFEMNLKRVGDTDWPSGGAVPPK